MRLMALGTAAGIALAASAGTASTAPLFAASSIEATGNIVQVAGGCGRGWHPNRWGRCVPNRYGYYRPYYRPFYGYGHEPWNRPSPGDYGAADQLNRQQLGWRWGY